LKKASNKHEKALADHFDTSLGHIDIVDSYKHIFNVNAWGKEFDVVIYNKEEIELIKQNMLEYLYSEMKSKNIELSGGLKVNLGNLITEDSFKKEVTENVFSVTNPINLVTQSLGYEFKDEFGEFFIWVKK
jgi:hypothetical protein